MTYTVFRLPGFRMWSVQPATLKLEHKVKSRDGLRARIDEWTRQLPFALKLRCNMNAVVFH